MGKVQKCWVGGTFFVVSKDECTVIMHALPNKELEVAELRKQELSCSLYILLELLLLLSLQLGCQQLDVPLHVRDKLLLVESWLFLEKTQGLLKNKLLGN